MNIMFRTPNRNRTTDRATGTRRVARFHVFVDR